MNGTDALLRIDGLSWEAGGRRRGVPPGPLSVGSGQTAVIVAGDTAEAEVLADILLGLDWRFRGKISVNGQEITMRPPEEREIGLVPAGGGLLPQLTVERNLVLAAREHRGARRSTAGSASWPRGCGSRASCTPVRTNWRTMSG